MQQQQVTELEVLIAQINFGQKVSGTTITKGGTTSKQPSADKCIVPTNSLNSESPIVLSPIGKQLFDAWKAGNAVLNQKLDVELMRKLEAKLVGTNADRKKLDTQRVKDVNKQLGGSKASSSKPCLGDCGFNTTKQYKFGGTKKFAFCHRKDCVEQRDAYAAKKGIRASSISEASPSRSRSPSPMVFNFGASNLNNNNVEEVEVVPTVKSESN